MPRRRRVVLAVFSQLYLSVHSGSIGSITVATKTRGNINDWSYGRGPEALGCPEIEMAPPRLHC